VAKEFKDLDLTQIKVLSQSEFHEARFAALAILTARFKRSKSDADRQELFDFYLSLLELGVVNNWDLIDSTAPYLGRQLLGSNPIAFLKTLANSGDLWKQRAAIMFTYGLVAEFELRPTFEIVEYLMDHEHDLIHKASGWMLREAGKKDLTKLRAFLEVHSAAMPRTMLRYAIEKMSKEERGYWLSQKSLK
jgi:3-methyladenine DNA glycosylase AlkD